MYLYKYVTFLSTEIQFMYPNADKKIHNKNKK